MAKGYTPSQRNWFLGVYDSSCHFLLKSGKFCGSSSQVQIHHLVPKRYYTEMHGPDPNLPLNGLALCGYHHIGLGYQGTLKWREGYVPVLHPDIVWAKRQYHHNKEIYNILFKEREAMIKAKKTYWNTTFDEDLEEIVNNIIGKQLRLKPDSYPWTIWQKELYFG